MLTTGFQLRAARSLIGMDQSTLADQAGINVNTVHSMEAVGVECLNHGQPGVRRAEAPGRQ